MGRKRNQKEVEEKSVGGRWFGDEREIRASTGNRFDEPSVVMSSLIVRVISDGDMAEIDGEVVL